ncbi:O-antigen ligase family protein [Chryseolinea lacunae]|uniref:O-antigen ligase family protein n=1 Tax=Chryseolinea lacunae TaxID=2801331 RepID=A0ABS1KM05_9BACT|nr:O-antigen ligase family protein [Chryseolinea lacunae]MBL0740375.1 O-antigen ligase family protein [Chryseolinea lacunae]
MSTRFYTLKDSWIVPCLLILANVGLLFLTNLFGIVINVLVIGIIGFISIFYFSYKYPRYNIFFLLGAAFLIPFFIKAFGLFGIPVGEAIQGLCFVILLTLTLNGRIGGIKTLPGILLCIWVFYLFLELLNPSATSRVAGALALRGYIPLISAFFIVYGSTETKSDVHLFYIAWFSLGLICGMYGLYQEFAGLPGFDYAWASSDENLYGALFTWGRLRKFSFFFSPSEFGMVMAITGVAAFIIFFYETKLRLRILSAVTCVVCLWSMLYTGSRTAMVMLPLGMAIFAGITLNRKVIIVVMCFMLAGTAVMFGPSSGAVYVMSTAFSGTDDPSMNVRLRNQQTIRAYIRANPIGFGLGSTGYLGMKYSPHTFIGSFPPDSEYVKIGIETGWVGLLLWCTLTAILFGYGVSVYFKTRDPVWRSVVVIALTVFFMMIVGLYPQEVFFISQVLSFLYTAMLGLLAKINGRVTAQEPKPKDSFDETSEIDDVVLHDAS